MLRLGAQPLDGDVVLGVLGIAAVAEHMGLALVGRCLVGHALLDRQLRQLLLVPIGQIKATLLGLLGGILALEEFLLLVLEVLLNLAVETVLVDIASTVPVTVESAEGHADGGKHALASGLVGPVVMKLEVFGLLLQLLVMLIGLLASLVGLLLEHVPLGDAVSSLDGAHVCALGQGFAVSGVGRTYLALGVGFVDAGVGGVVDRVGCALERNGLVLWVWDGRWRLGAAVGCTGGRRSDGRSARNRRDIGGRWGGWSAGLLERVQGGGVRVLWQRRRGVGVVGVVCCGLVGRTHGRRRGVRGGDAGAGDFLQLLVVLWGQVHWLCS